MLVLLLLLVSSHAQVDDFLDDGRHGKDIVSGCYGTNKDCSDEVLICNNELEQEGTEINFDSLKWCIYRLVAEGEASSCCNDYVVVGQQLDPDYVDISNTGTLTPTPGPIPVPDGETPAPTGNPNKCPKIRNSQECLKHGGCQWDYWTRVCTAFSFDTSQCANDNSDCRKELNACIESEERAGRTPDQRNLEPCVLMNPQSNCCKLFTDTHLTIVGPARQNRPDRYDLENCELYKRNNACKNQDHCKWDRSKKICEPMKGIEAPGLYYVPEMACGYKSFKLTFRDKPTTIKRNVKTSCECAQYCGPNFEHWVYRQRTSKCACTNQAIVKVARGKEGWWGSSTKSARKRDRE